MSDLLVRSAGSRSAGLPKGFFTHDDSPLSVLVAVRMGQVAKDPLKKGGPEKPQGIAQVGYDAAVREAVALNERPGCSLIRGEDSAN